MIYDVEVAARGGWGTDSTTSNRRWALDRARELGLRGEKVQVIDRTGHIIAESKSE